MAPTTSEGLARDARRGLKPVRLPRALDEPRDAERALGDVNFLVARAFSQEYFKSTSRVHTTVPIGHLSNILAIAADLADIRELNRVDPATGRPLPRDAD